MISRTARLARVAAQNGSRRIQPSVTPNFKFGALRSISISACENMVAPSSTETPAAAPVDAAVLDPALHPITAAPDVYIPTYVNDNILGPFDAMEFLMEAVHTGTGAEWAVVIAGSTVAVRLLMFPVILSVMKNSSRLQRVQGQVKSLQERMTATAQTDPALSSRYMKEINEIFEKNNCHPFKSIRGILVQMPVFMSFFFAIRRIAEVDPTFAGSGGGAILPWITDLSIADPYHICPIVTAGTMALTIELGADGQQVQQNPMAKNVMRAFSLVVIPFTWNMPAGLFCYWITSNLMSLTQVGVLKIPPVRDFFGLLPPPPPEVKPGDVPIQFMPVKPAVSADSSDTSAPRKTFGRKGSANRKKKGKR